VFTEAMPAESEKPLRRHSLRDLRTGRDRVPADRAPS
jgi:hypothetical protein